MGGLTLTLTLTLTLPSVWRIALDMNLAENQETDQGSGRKKSAFVLAKERHGDEWLLQLATEVAEALHALVNSTRVFVKCHSATAATS